MNQLEGKVIEWAEERGILEKGTPEAQNRKTVEEVEELCEALAWDHDPAIMDAIGDIGVTLIIQARMHGWTLQYCIDKAYQVIRDRKGKMVNGQFIKEVRNGEKVAAD